MTRRLGSCLAAAAFLVLAACGNESPTTTGSDRDSADLPGRFAEPRVTWAQGTTLHYGGDDYRLPAPAPPTTNAAPPRTSPRNTGTTASP